MTIEHGLTLYLKKDASSELIKAVQEIEDRADLCFHSLKILGLPSDVALWAILLGGIDLVEKEIKMRGDNTPHLEATLVNASSIASTAMKWVMKNGCHSSVIGHRTWTGELARKVNEAVALAHHYGAFLNAFPMWHKDRYGVELISPIHARFTVMGSDIDRRVSAYQKGHRPKAGRYQGVRPEKVGPTPKILDQFEEIYSHCRPVSFYGFQCDDPWILWRELLPEYQSRLAAIFRRDDALSLGDYTLGEFEKFYAALLAVCAAHEYLCSIWDQRVGAYPFESAILIRSIDSWADVLSKLAEISPVSCESMIRDLSFNFLSSPNLHVHPFVPLDSPMTQLALAPHFPLHSRPDENILWVCSKRRSVQFDAASLTKEPEMRATLETACTRYSPQGPIPLPKPNPDIDLFLMDEDSSTVVIAELKWIRKPTTAFERIKRDEDVLKGIDQLRRIRQFLVQNPNYLVSGRKLPRPLNEYENVRYLLIARDHWVWSPPTADGAIVAFDPFSASITRSTSLRLAIDDMLTYDWLPVEGRDFSVSYDKSWANGVAIETETFYAI